MRSQVQAAPFLQRVIGLSLKDRVRSLVILARLSIAATPPPLICWNLAPDMQYKKRMDNGEQWILKNLFKKKKSLIKVSTQTTYLYQGQTSSISCRNWVPQFISICGSTDILLRLPGKCLTIFLIPIFRTFVKIWSKLPRFSTLNKKYLLIFSCSDLIPYSQAMADKYKQVLPIVTDIWSSFLSQEQRPCKRWI